MSSLTEFHDNLRTLLEDVQKFLVQTLKSYKLKEDAVVEKESILRKMRAIHHERPNWLPDLPDECDEEYEDCAAFTDSSSHHDENNVSKDDEDSHSFDEGSLEVKEAIPASSLTEPVKAGFLDKKRKQETGLSVMLQPYQKRWCVIKDSTLYYYASQKDKKQKGAFILDEYEARPYVTNRKDCGFELVCPGHRTYIFSACSPEECTSWVDAIASVSKATMELSKRPIGDDDMDDGVDYIEPEESLAGAKVVEADTKKKRKELPPPPIEEEIYDDGETANDGNAEETPIEEDIYYDPDEEAQRPRSQTPVEEIIEDDIYDDTDEVRSDQPPQIPNRPRPNKLPSIPRSPSPVEELIEDDIYDDTGNPDDAPPEVPVTPRPRALPTSPATKTEQAPNRDTDYDNLYLAIWDCFASETNELSFKRGDVIHVVGHDYEKYDWLTGEVNGHLGLVPKNYLMRAYERIQ